MISEQDFENMRVEYIRHGRLMDLLFNNKELWDLVKVNHINKYVELVVNSEDFDRLKEILQENKMANIDHVSRRTFTHSVCDRYEPVDEFFNITVITNI